MTGTLSRMARARCAQEELAIQRGESVHMGTPELCRDDSFGSGRRMALAGTGEYLLTWQKMTA
jgi:hypothetical protein